MDKLKRITQKIKNNEPVIGASVCFSDCLVTELLCYAGYDLIWIDMEHTALEKKDVLHHIIAANEAGAAAFVRVPWNDPVLVKPIIDMGPDGIIFPFVCTKDEAERAVKSCLYPLEGIRGFGPMRAIRHNFMDLKEYIDNAGRNIWKIIQIEHIDGVNNLEEILSVEGIDSVVVGSMDLSGSVGLLGETNHEELIKLYNKIAEKVNKTDIPLAIATGSNPKTIQEWIDRGISWMTIGRDFDFLSSCAFSDLQKIKKLF